MDLEKLKKVRNQLRNERTDLALSGGSFSGIYNERLQSLNLRIEAINKAIWHLENPEQP